MKLIETAAHVIQVWTRATLLLFWAILARDYCVVVAERVESHAGALLVLKT